MLILHEGLNQTLEFLIKLLFKRLLEKTISKRLWIL